MQRVLALIGVTVIVVLLVWSLGSSPDERSDGSFDGDVPADPDSQPTLEAQPPQVDNQPCLALGELYWMGMSGVMDGIAAQAEGGQRSRDGEEVAP